MPCRCHMVFFPAGKSGQPRGLLSPAARLPIGGANVSSENQPSHSEASVLPAGRDSPAYDAVMAGPPYSVLLSAGGTVSVIDQSGLFHGDRLQKLSLMAYLYWPFLFLASNGYGRLEISVHRISACLGRFAPSEEELQSYFQEYAAAHLLFLYQAGAKTWGVWDTDPKFLPRWKTAEDRKSPAPPEPDFTNWLREYRLVDITPLPKSSENFGKFPSGGGVGVVVGDGVGDGKNPCALPENGNARMAGPSPVSFTETPDALFPVGAKPPVKATRGTLTPSQESWFSEWWSAYWLHKARKPAREAFKRHVTSEARFQQIMAAVEAQRPEMLAREPSKRPHGATWLNAERWDDEVTADATPADKALDQIYGSVR